MRLHLGLAYQLRLLMLPLTIVYRAELFYFQLTDPIRLTNASLTFPLEIAHHHFPHLHLAVVKKSEPELAPIGLEIAHFRLRRALTFK